MKPIQSNTELAAYLIECTLATISSMAMKKSRPKYEYKRQINIAQNGIDTWKNLGIPKEDAKSNTRVTGILKSGESVAGWAKKYEAETPNTVTCKFCKKKVTAATAHRHEHGWVGDECCWDERLKTTA